MAPGDAWVETQWGELFLEKHQWGDAAKSFQAALKSQPDYAPAQIGLARAVVQENPAAAEKFARRALELNPSDAGAHLFLADLATFEEKKEEARESIAKALSLNPNSLEGHAKSAALYYVEGKDADYKQAVSAALKINPCVRRGLPRRWRDYSPLLSIRGGGGAGTTGDCHGSRESQVAG